MLGQAELKLNINGVNRWLLWAKQASAACNLKFIAFTGNAMLMMGEKDDEL